eukprot:comp23538_c0_seq1/m.39670 comp23538_c0_seq1/g.39670  ORF comp23538_c0_seq1/g.39670 comp23538_c0_seq1/m.39670 type:complete len:472 (+) comp23538_c0_seq1:513-1928(+)
MRQNLLSFRGVVASIVCTAQAVECLDVVRVLIQHLLAHADALCVLLQFEVACSHVESGCSHKRRLFAFLLIRSEPGLGIQEFLGVFVVLEGCVVFALLEQCGARLLERLRPTQFLIRGHLPTILGLGEVLQRDCVGFGMIRHSLRLGVLVAGLDNNLVLLTLVHLQDSLLNSIRQLCAAKLNLAEWLPVDGHGHSGKLIGALVTLAIDQLDALDCPPSNLNHLLPAGHRHLKLDRSIGGNVRGEAGITVGIFWLTLDAPYSSLLHLQQGLFHPLGHLAGPNGHPHLLLVHKHIPAGCKPFVGDQAFLPILRVAPSFTLRHLLARDPAISGDILPTSPANQLHIEIQGCIGRDLGWGSTFAVCVVCPALQNCMLPLLHGGHTLVPALDHLALANLKGEGLIACPAAIKLRAVKEGADIVHRHVVPALGRLIACALLKDGLHKPPIAANINRSSHVLFSCRSIVHSCLALRRR